MSSPWFEGDIDFGHKASWRGGHGTGKNRLASALTRRWSLRGPDVNLNTSPPSSETLVGSDRISPIVSRTATETKDIYDEARKQAEREVSLGVWEGLRIYRAAAMWSLLLTGSIIIPAFGTGLTASLLAFPDFARNYGTRFPNGIYQVSASQENHLTGGIFAGSMVGLILNGLICDAIGFKKTYYIALGIATSAVFLSFFSDGSMGLLLAGQIISSISWGMFQTLSVAYTSEICPVCLRGYLIAADNIYWLSGQLLSTGMVHGLLTVPGDISYKLPLALQWVFPPLVLIAVIFAPESPWWLMRQGNMIEVETVLKRLVSTPEAVSDSVIQAQILLMRVTDDHEKALSPGTQFWDCFRGINLRRTEITMVAWAGQILCGATLMGYSIYFFTNAGLSETQAFSLSYGQLAIGLFGNILSWFLMAYLGRRTMYIAGLTGVCVLMIAVGAAGFAPATDNYGPFSYNEAGLWAVGCLLMVCTFVFNLTIGPVCYAIVAESSSTRLRQKTIVISRMTYNIIAFADSFLVPAQMSPLRWNWGGKTGLFWAGISVLLIVWCYFRLHESKGRTYHELNVLFEHRIKARKFAGTKVDALKSQSFTVQPQSSNDKEMDAEALRWENSITPE